ncbi:MAG: hypothetical protein BroJett025_03490 [Patescibacteria group bacterium]|nr:MAG: hypothetical protein BroJett025_03490 [Patescibacteria group bacterium]
MKRYVGFSSIEAEFGYPSLADIGVMETHYPYQHEKLSDAMQRLQTKFQVLQNELAEFSKEKSGSRWQILGRPKITQAERQPFLDRILALKDELHAHYQTASGSEKRKIIDWLIYMQSIMYGQLKLRRGNFTRGLNAKHK